MVRRSGVDKCYRLPCICHESRVFPAFPIIDAIFSAAAQSTEESRAYRFFRDNRRD